MPKFVELWVYLSATPLLGLTATLVVYTPGASRLHPSDRRRGPTRSSGQ